MEKEELENEIIGAIQRAFANAEPNEPKRHGKWSLYNKHEIIHYGNEEYRKLIGTPHRFLNGLQCSECKKVSMVLESIEYEFCPHCGARMDSR